MLMLRTGEDNSRKVSSGQVERSLNAELQLDKLYLAGRLEGF